MNHKDGIYLSVRGIAPWSARVTVQRVDRLLALMAFVACAAAGVGIWIGRDPSIVTVSALLAAAIVAGVGYMRSN